MADMRAICSECGHTRAWHDREAARALRSGELASDRRCYHEIGGAGCRCGGFRDSGQVAMPGAARAGGEPLRLGILVALLFLTVPALLYAYRAQAPAAPSIPLSQAIAEINLGEVERVSISGQRATLELRNGERHQTTMPERDDTLQRVVADYNTAHPGRPIEMEITTESSALAGLTAALLSLLPVLLFGAFFVYFMSRARLR